MSKVKRVMDDYGEFDIDETEFWYWFRTLNDEVFEGVVPMPDVIEDCDPSDTESWAYVKHIDAGDNTIVGLYIRRSYPSKAIFVNILAHEMVHIWQLKVNGDSGNHNKHFYSWKERFEEFGLELKRSC